VLVNIGTVEEVGGVSVCVVVMVATTVMRKELVSSSTNPADIAVLVSHCPGPKLACHPLKYLSP
jgi:hypothetical protein